MSRIGIRPITLPAGVQVKIIPTVVTVVGPNGQQLVDLVHGIKVSQKDHQLVVERVNDAKQNRAMHGTVRALLQNAVSGVTVKFEKKLELVGIGYRANVEGSTLNLQVGFTHPVKLDIPEGLSAKVEKNVIVVTGLDKQALGQFCANVRQVRKPEPYKGKGIRYLGELVRMKQGKAVKAAGA